MKKIVLLGVLCACGLAVCAQNLDWKSATHYKKATAKEQLTKRFTQYVKFDTQCDDEFHHDNPNGKVVPVHKH